MKKTLYVLAVLLIVAGTVYASGSSEAEALDEEMLVVGQIAEPKALDPHTVTAVNDFRILVNIYEGLVQFQDGSLTVEPALARSWEISDDGRVYTFHLREGVSFHDGTPFNAEAVKFNFDRMLDEDHP
ncbi:MAG: ABC transporter substrate-binding protein, partial [Alkalispirochaeta sp.]